MPLEERVSAEAFAARLRALNTGPRFAIAVSGGRDSMALARLSAEFCKNTGGECAALIVDHGLREGSAGEAAQAKSWCEAVGLAAHVLRWEGAKPSSGVQAAARQARYRLLAQAAAQKGYPAILTAHSADDQAETVAMRLRRGSGAKGLAGMAAAVLIAAGAGAPVRLLRPLLEFTRTQLTATVVHYRQSYVDDPSNEDLAYERVRIRKALASSDALTERESLLQLAARMQAEASALEAVAQQAFARAGGFFTRWGGVCLNHDDLGESSGDVMAQLIRAVSGADYAPSAEDAQSAFRSALETGAAPLGGVLMKKSGDQIWLFREPAALLGRAGVAPASPENVAADSALLWDHRFMIRVDAPASVAPLGDEGVAALGAAAGLFEGPRDALLSLPGISSSGRLIGAPGVLFRKGLLWRARPLAAERFVRGIVRF